MQVARIFVLVIFGVSASAFAGSTFICAEPGGKRLIHVDGNDVGPVDGPRALAIDGEDIRDRDGKRLLVVDDHDVRPEPAGVKIATFDGEDIRRGAGRKVMINYHERDLCPTSADNRIYSIEGDTLTKQQLVAGLYLLKPEWFKLSDADTKAQVDAMKEANAEQEKLDEADQAAGNYMVLNSSGIMEHLGQGTLTVAAKVSDAYPIEFDLTPGGGPKLNGVGAYQVIGGDKTFWAAYGTPNTVGLCVYEIAGGKLSGTWHVNGTTVNGTEELTGPASLDGNYKIAAAKSPGTGAAYVGTVAIYPLKITGAIDSAKPYSLVWTIGGVKIKGIGIRTGNTLVVASGTGAATMIAKYVIDNGSMNSEWYKVGSMEHGSAAATRMN